MKIKRQKKHIILTAMIASAGLSQGAVIAWSTEQSTTATGGATVAYTTLTTIVERAQFGDSAIQTGWTDGDAGTTNSNLSTVLANTPSGNGAWTASTADLGVVASSHSWATGSTQTIQLTGLNVGDQYKVQFFMNDNRVFGATVLGDRSIVYSDGEAAPATIQTTRGDGLSVIGTFTATAATQTVEVAGGTGTADVDFGLNGYILSTTPAPEPSSTALLGLGGLALILRRRK